MKLVIMTKPTFFVEEDKILTTLFEEGMDDLHLYKPQSTPMYSERLLSLLPENYYRKITVHDHYYLKNEYGLGKIHIDSPSEQLPYDYKSEYLFLKCNFQDNPDIRTCDGLSLKELESASSNGFIDKRIYAYGETNLDNIKIAKELGFGGVVICNDLWNRFDIHKEIDYKRLMAHFEKLHKATS